MLVEWGSALNDDLRVSTTQASFEPLPQFLLESSGELEESDEIRDNAPKLTFREKLQKFRISAEFVTEMYLLGTMAELYAYLQKYKDNEQVLLAYPLIKDLYQRIQEIGFSVEGFTLLLILLPALRMIQMAKNSLARNKREKDEFDNMINDAVQQTHLTLVKLGLEPAEKVIRKERSNDDWTDET